MYEDALLEVLKTLATGVILVDDGWRVVYANARAKSILAVNGGLTIESGVLVTTTSNETAQLRGLKSCSLREEVERDDADATTMFVTRTESRWPLFVAASHLPTSCPDGGPGNRLTVLLINDPEQQEPLDRDSLSRLFGLTAAEAAVAQAVAKGLGLQHAVEELGISINTVRTHQKRVFQKTGTSRQAELVKLMFGSVPPMRTR